MKKIKNLKIYLLVMFLIASCVLSACSQPTDAVSGNSGSQPQGSKNPDVEHPDPADELDYTLLETDGTYYLIFDDITVYNSGGKSEVSTLSFATIKELKDAIKTGDLKEWQKEVIATSFNRDDVGVKVLNLEKLYSPKIPMDGTVDSVIWSGENYSFSMTLDENIFGMLHVYTDVRYTNVFESDYKNYFEKDTISVSNLETLGDGKTVTYYCTSAAQLMQVRYVLTDGNRTFTVDRTYRYGEAEANDEGGYDLTNITMYCEDGGKKYVVDLFGFVDDSDDNWLLSFGLSEYIDNELAVK